MLAGRQSVELLSIASVQKIFAKLSSLQYITLARKKLIGTQSCLKTLHFFSSSIYFLHSIVSRFHYRVYKSPKLGPALSQMNPVHTLSFYLFYFQFNIIFKSKPRSSKWSFPSGFPSKNLHAFLFSPHTRHIPNHLKRYHASQVEYIYAFYKRVGIFKNVM